MQSLLPLLSLLTLALSSRPSLGLSSEDTSTPSPFHLRLVQELGTALPSHFKNRDCPAIFSNITTNASSEWRTEPEWPPPRFIPKHLLRHFSMNGSAHIAMAYHLPNTFRDVYRHWKFSVITDLISGKDKSDRCSGHWKHDCFKPLKRNDLFINGKVGLVVGSEYPWAESLLVRLGARQIITLERVRTNLDHPLMTAYTHDELSDLYRSGRLPSFDFAFAYSSVEHEGLGKSGEGLDAYGDIVLMDKIHCLLKPGGVLFLAVPIGPDYLHWNTYRMYGRHRLPLLLEGWNLVNVLGNFTSLMPSKEKPSPKPPILILRKS